MLKEILQSLKAKGRSFLIEDGIHIPLKAEATEYRFMGDRRFHLDIGYLRDNNAYDYRQIIEGFLPDEDEEDDFEDAEIVIETALHQLWTGTVCPIDTWSLTDKLTQMYNHFFERN